MNKVLTLTAAAFIATSGLAFAQDSVVIEVPQSATGLCYRAPR